MRINLGRALPMFSAEDGGSGGEGAAAAAATDPANAGSVLFPSEGGGDQGGDKPEADAPAGEWKEYENDPSKTDEENAAAKAEHDKTKPADGEKDKKSDDPADQVPEDGKYELAMPEGVEVDQELVDALGPQFKELGLTNKQAQALADKFIEIQQGRVTKQGETWANTISGWVDEAKADKEIGGTNWDKTVGDAQRAVKTLGTPELRAYMEASGGGNHPELIRFMAKVGAMIKEDDPANGGAEGAGKPAEAAHILFPTDAPKG